MPHLAQNLAIAVDYAYIGTGLLWATLTAKLPTLYRNRAWGFGAFIFSCGTGHALVGLGLMDVAGAWHWGTATISAIEAIALTQAARQIFATIKSDQLLTTIADTIDAMVVMDWEPDSDDLRITYSNAEARRQWREDFTGQLLCVCMPLNRTVEPIGRTGTLFDHYKACALTGQDGRFRIEFPSLNVKGTYFEAQFKQLDAGQVWVTWRDRTEEEALRREQEWLLTRDRMTKILNRDFFQESARIALNDQARTGEPVSLIWIDLDKFKLINDTHGHLVGDAYLIEFARRLDEFSRQADVAARVGGDEFVLLLRDTGPVMALQIAHRLHDAVTAELFTHGHITEPMRCSVGVATAGDGDDLESLTREADDAMYVAKRGDKSVHSGNQTAVEALQLKQQFIAAVGAREVVPWYQPIFDLQADGVIMDAPVVGAEALARWPRKSGVVLPGNFLALCRSDGELMDSFCDSQLKQVCAQAKTWRSQGWDGWLSFNLSRRAMDRTNLAQWLTNATTAAGLERGAIALEVTEDLAPGPVADKLRAAIDELMGIDQIIFWDDFGAEGTGQQLELIDAGMALKLERRLVHGLSDRPSMIATARAIIGLCDELGIAVIAEGVERLSDAQVMRDLGCDLGQGFLWSPAIAPDEFERRWLQK